MSAVWDNAIPISLLVSIVAILVSLVVLALRGFRLYRTVKRNARTLSAAASALSADVERVADAAGRLPERQAEIQQALEDLQMRAAVIGVLARQSLLARRVLMGPLRYVGR